MNVEERDDALARVTAQINEYVLAHPYATSSDPALRKLWIKRAEAETERLSAVRDSSD